MPRLKWKSAFVFMFESPVFKKALYCGGILILIFPPFGWIIALGYRSLILRHLLNTAEVAQIELPKEALRCFRSGLGAVAVIFSYFLPFMLFYWSLVAYHYDLSEHGVEVFCFFALILLFIPIFLPALPLFYAWYFPWIKFSASESAILGIIFLLTTFIMPAVFMQVSLKGSYWGALRSKHAIRTIMNFPFEYLEAWLISSFLIAMSFIIFPLFPLITFWSYLVIGMLFNNVLAFDTDTEVSERMRFFKQKYKLIS